MSDNSSSTGSSGSSTNSWTLLSPEEAAVENVGPVDDGTESLGDVPSLSEEVTGAAVEFKSNDNSVETVLSEEGHQVCQETSPGSSEGPILSSLDLNVESQPPVIHDILTTSHGDNEHVGTTPFVTNIELGAPLNIPDSELLTTQSEESGLAPPPTEDPVTTEQQIDSPDIGLFPAGTAGKSPVGTPEVNIPAETIAATDPPSHAVADITRAPDGTEPSQYRESLGAESLTDDSRAPETIGSVEAEEETATEKEEVESQIRDEREDEEEEEEEEPSSSFDFGDASSFEGGLRRRNIPPFDAPRPRTSDEEDEEEDGEFKLAEKKEEEKSWFSLNKCIVGALILLFLGSLFLSGDFDGPEPSDGEQSQDWLSGDPQDMKDLLDKLTQENQQITHLEAQLRSEKEQLESALKEVAASGDERGKADLEKENANLREELSFLPELKKELESLRARVTELNQLIDNQETPLTTPSPPPQSGEKRVVTDGESTQKAFGPPSKKDKNKEGKLKDELKRQKALLEESGKRLKGMSKDGGDRVRVRDHLAAIQKELSEKVKRWAEKKPQDSKGKGKIKERDHWKKEEKKKWKGEKDKKHSKEEEWRGKEERKKKEQKSQKENSHKEAWRKHQDEWERKKGERKMDREERRKEKPWHSRSRKHSHNHHGRHHHHHHHHDQNDFWRDQEQKLRRNIRPQLDCSSLEDCASKEGLYPVELPEFEELLEGYLSKLEGSSSESKDKIRRLTAEFFENGVFIHNRVLFSDFAEDVADILEDMVDVLEDGGKKKDDSLEEEMEEFEREAMWKFAATA